MTRVSFTVPIRTGQGLNARLHWASKARKVKHERDAVAYRWPRIDLAPVITITLTRFSPGEMDGDNLQGSLKGIRDGVAAKLRLDDACRLVEWKYAQAKGAAGVLVEMELPTR